MEASACFKNIRHNDPFLLVTSYFLPNGIWLILPILISFAIAQYLVGGGTARRSSATTKPSSSSSTTSPEKTPAKHVRIQQKQLTVRTPGKSARDATPEPRGAAATSSPAAKSRSRSRLSSVESHLLMDTMPTDTSPGPTKRRGRGRKASP
jgi:hypothetical protein